MFDAFVSFTKNLFNDDQPPATSQRSINEENRKSRINPPIDDFEFVKPLNLWNREDLQLILLENKIQSCYDEKFRKGLQKYGVGVQYKQPNIQIIRQFMIDMRDLYLIIISQKKNARNLKEELDRLSEQFYSEYFPMMTRYMNSPDSQIKVIESVFALLPGSFATRNDEKLNDIIYKFYTYEKLVVVRMTENRLQDSASFKKTCNRIDSLHGDANAYLGRVTRLKDIILTSKTSVLLMKNTIIKKFSKKMKVQKILYILEKVKGKYQKVINYCNKDLAETSMFTYGELYKIFLISLVNFKSDAQKFTSLKLLRKFDEIVTKKLVSIKKRMKNEMYSELKTLVANPRARRTEKLGMLVELHKSVSISSKEILDKSRIEGKLPKGLELFDDSKVLEDHFADIISYNPGLDTERAKELIFGGGTSATIGDARIFSRGILKPGGDFDSSFVPR